MSPNLKDALDNADGRFNRPPVGNGGFNRAYARTVLSAAPAANRRCIRYASAAR